MDKFEFVVHKDMIGWYAALMRADGTYVKRSLSTPYSTKAERWARQAACHGFDAHHKSCSSCEDRDEAVSRDN